VALRSELGSGSRAEGARAVPASWHPDVWLSARHPATRLCHRRVSLFGCRAVSPPRPERHAAGRAQRRSRLAVRPPPEAARRGPTALRAVGARSGLDRREHGPTVAQPGHHVIRRHPPGHGSFRGPRRGRTMASGKAGAPMSRTRSRRGVPQGRTRGRRASSRWGQAAAGRAYAGRISCGLAPTVMPRPTRPTCPSGTRRRRARCCASPPRACARRPPSPAAGRCAPPTSDPSP
jgi:hypothetical protein